MADTFAKEFEKFATSTHPLSKNIDPTTDVLPDLSFVEDPRGRKLELICARK